jgi:hypothetical protein
VGGAGLVFFFNDTATTEKEKTLAVITEWYRLFGDKAVTVKQLTEAALRTEFWGGMNKFTNEPLKTAIQAVTEEDASYIDGQLFGKWLQVHKDNHIGPYLICREGTKHGVAIWRIVKKGVDRLDGKQAAKSWPHSDLFT